MNMVCGGFTCSKNALAALNVLYILVAFILIGVAAYSKAQALVTSLALVGSIVACGVFLLLIAIIGLIGALKHHQVLLFFYMIILFLLFLLQFALACACLAVNSAQQKNLVQSGWNLASNDMRASIQNKLNCCGFDHVDGKKDLPHPSCAELQCCVDNPSPCCNGTETSDNDEPCHCSRCWEELKIPVDRSFKITGGVGLFFSFTEIVGVWLALRYRNQKDPRANPSAFL